VTALAWYNGAPTAGVPLSNRAIAYGDGLFETIRVEHHRASLLRRHLRRLARGCERLGMRIDGAALDREIAAVLDDHGSGVMKIIVARESDERGYAVPAHADAARLLQFFPREFTADARNSEGVAVRICRLRLSEQPALAGLKHLNRLEQVLARSEWDDPAIAEGLMLDSSARLVEGITSNLFLVRDGVLSTPDLKRCGVAGILREVILEQLAPGARVTDLSLDDMVAADEVFLCNSVAGIWPVRTIDGLHKPVGETTRALQQRLQQLIEHEAQ